MAPNTMTNENYAEQQARAQVSSICAMVAALECDWDRLEELREEQEDLVGAVAVAQCDADEMADTANSETYATALADAQRELVEWNDENAEELAELVEAAGEHADYDAAMEAIHCDPLSVEVRSGWSEPGDSLDPSEFRIVLCTGGPHVELQGDLDRYGDPSRVRVLYSDWGTSGELFDFDRTAVLTYCQQHHVGA
jgi:hypothetical protein